MLVLTTDGNCEFCEGAGIIDMREILPGEIPKIGGHTPTRLVRTICKCVKSKEIKDEL